MASIHEALVDNLQTEMSYIEETQRLMDSSSKHIQNYKQQINEIGETININNQSIVDMEAQLALSVSKGDLQVGDEDYNNLVNTIQKLKDSTR